VVIELAAIAEALPRLTGDAVKLAVHLAVEPTRRVDVAWARVAARGIGTTPKIISRAVQELVSEGLLDLTGRVDVASAATESHPDVVGSRGSESEETKSTKDEALKATADELPPWERSQDPGGRRRASVDTEGRSPEVSDNARGGGRAGARSPQPGAHRRVVGAFHAAFLAAYEATPTWGAREGRMVKELLKLHDESEVLRRMRVMFDEPRRFPPPPYTMAAFATHFDLFAAVPARGGMTGHRRTGEGYYGSVTDD
jgi:hypothetical protein